MHVWEGKDRKRENVCVCWSPAGRLGRAVLPVHWASDLCSPRQHLSTPTSCLHFKLELIQTCCSWKEAISTGSNRKMIREGI